MPSYKKIVLTKGFAVVLEKEDDFKKWFPMINFYDQEGDLIISATPDQVKYVYDAIVHMFSDMVSQDYDVVAVGRAQARYQCQFIGGLIYFLPAISSNIKDAVIIIDREAGAFLKNAIMEIA